MTTLFLFPMLVSSERGSGCSRLRRPGPRPSHAAQRGTTLRPAVLCVAAVPQRAGHEVVGTIDQLVTRIVEGSLSPKESAVLKEDPAYW